MEKTDPRAVPSIRLSNGEEIPCIGMGTFGSDRFTPEQVSSAVAGAIRAGYRLFDCASVYGNEDLIGKVFEDAIASGEVKREELFITSKVWNDMHGRGDVLLSCAKSLRDLRIDYLDFYFVHWPFPNATVTAGIPTASRFRSMSLCQPGVRWSAFTIWGS